MGWTTGLKTQRLEAPRSRARVPLSVGAYPPLKTPAQRLLRGRLNFCRQRPFACALRAHSCRHNCCCCSAPPRNITAATAASARAKLHLAILERPANAARRHRLNRAGCQRLPGLPCACGACAAPILHAVTQPQLTPAPAPATAPDPVPPAQPGIVYAPLISSRSSRTPCLKLPRLPPLPPQPAQEYRLGPASEDSYDPAVSFRPIPEFLPALAFTHLLHCLERGTACPCPRCRARLTAALWEGTNPLPLHSR
eukprot:3846719-Pleurochrysis_carterae.AAC.4